MTRLTPTLFPPLDRDNSTLALRSLLIAGMITPVQNGDGGVNIQIVQGSPLGVFAAVDPWLRMAVGDHLEIYWDNTLMAVRDVGALDLDQRLFFFLPADTIVPDWAERVFYRLTRNGSTSSEDSVALRIRVKLDSPGGVDKDPHLPGHSELAAPRLPQDVIENGVDEEWARLGVPVEIAAYPGRAARDTIELQWGDAYMAHTVTDAEAGSGNSIVMMVDQAMILAGGDSPNLLVHYQVYDEVWNFSSDWSLRTFVNVEAGAHRLIAPVIKEAFNGTIDLGQLGTDDVTVQIEVRGLPFELGDTVTMTWVGLPNTGNPLVFERSVIIDNIPSVTEVKVPNAQIRAIIDGQGEASYVLRKANGDPPQSSKRAFARVTGKIPLPAPIVFEAVGDTLDPTLEQAHVAIPVYDKMANGDLIDLIWLGMMQNGTPLLHEDQHIVSGSEVGTVIYFPVMAEHLAPLVNGTLDVSYRVSNDALAPRDVRVSSHVNLMVGQRYAELPAPSVDEAVDNVLDPETVPHHATLRVPYTGTSVGDTLTWYWQGENPDGSASDWVPITTPVAGKPVTFNIPRSLIEPNINNVVKVYYALKLASTGRYKYSAVLDLTIGKLIGELPKPQVLEANADDTLDPMRGQNGVTVRVGYQSMDPQDIITLVWLGAPGAGSPADQSVSGNSVGQVEFAIAGSVIGANVDHDVMVMYRVQRYMTEKQSDILQLRIKAIPDNLLPSPLITQADQPTRVLNLATFAGNATTTLGIWPFIKSGQRVWLRLDGETENGGPHSIALLDGRPVTSGETGTGLSELLLRNELEKLGQDTRLTTVCKVGFSETPNESAALPFPATVYTFKRHHDWVTPVIVSVRDARGELANGATTFDNELELSGTGTIDTELEIFDGAARLTATRTTMSGTWAVRLTSLTPKAYQVTAAALDGSGMVSQPRTWEVLANLTPTIERVVDGRGPVSNGGTTVDNTVTASGRASPDQRIELFDGTVSKGTTTTDATGAWSLAVSGLAVASHPLKARALYGTGLESMIWTIIVATAITPTISSIQGSAGREIPAGGFTADTRVALTGTANANLEVEVFDGATSQGKVTANAAGIWTLTVTGLSVTAHAMKAKAIYGSGAESAVRNFTVVAVVNPTITAVVDQNNQPIANGGSTYASSVTASGQASIHQLVEVFDGTVSKGTTTTDATGAWSMLVSQLAVASHPLKARALYGTGPESLIWTIIVAAGITPTISSIKDSVGREIPAGGFTADTRVALTGTANANLEVEVFDGATSKGLATANGNGVWTLALTGLGIGAHPIKAVAQYGSGEASAVRSFTVVALAAPTISNIKDSANTEIPANGSTSDTSVTVSGTAPADRQVEIFDGATSKGLATANGNGVWTLALTGLATGAHAIKAVAQYGSGEASAVRSFTVVALAAPTISNIKDSANTEIPANGSTSDTSVTVSGTAPAGRQVEIFDGATSKGLATANGNGVWTLALTGLGIGAHPIKAVAQYGSGEASAVRSFTVLAATAVAITQVEDSRGNPIANGGTTTDTSGTVEGTVTFS